MRRAYAQWRRRGLSAAPPLGPCAQRRHRHPQPGGMPSGIQSIQIQDALPHLRCDIVYYYIIPPYC